VLPGRAPHPILRSSPTCSSPQITVGLCFYRDCHALLDETLTVMS
jgi:hypothetical protein